jgi:putative ABC transport system substrate-binding protein
MLWFGYPPSEAGLQRSRFLQELRTLGWVEGQNLVIERRSAAFSGEKLPDLVAELLRLKVDVIVALGGRAARAAKKATTTVPIVIAVGDALEQGLVTNLARPAGNITGFTNINPDLSGKRLELLRDCLKTGPEACWQVDTFSGHLTGARSPYNNIITNSLNL